MSDPMNPYGTPGGYGQSPYDQQGSYGAQPPYGSGQAGYGAGQPGVQSPYGQPQGAYGQPAYGQPVYGQTAYRLNPAVERVRSNASMVRIMAFVSFVTLGPILSVGAWIWGGSLMKEAQMVDAPADVVRDLQGARTTAIVCALVEVVGFVLLIGIPLLLALLDPSYV